MDLMFQHVKLYYNDVLMKGLVLRPQGRHGMAWHLRVHRQSNLPSSSMFRLIVGCNDKEGLPSPLTPSLVIAFHSTQGILRWSSLNQATDVPPGQYIICICI